MSAPPPPDVQDLLARNQAWAEGKVAADRDFFRRLVAEQAPAYFWVGCSDSRVPANSIVGLEPGEMFVHRNVANLALTHDPSFLAALQYAVHVLKVRHILVVGHQGCGGVRAALLDLKLGSIDGWLSPIRELAREHAAELDDLPDETARVSRLCELNVRRQVGNVAGSAFVQEAWAAGAALAVHGWCYALETGRLRDLGVTVDGAASGG